MDKPKYIVLFLLLTFVFIVKIDSAARAFYGDLTETVVSIKGKKSTKEDGYYEITLNALSHCHRLNLVRVYDKDGKKIFPDDEALGGILTEENEEYKREFLVKDDPFPVVVDLREWGKSKMKDKNCDAAIEESEPPDYHRHGAFLEAGTAAAYHGLKAGRSMDPQEPIKKPEFEKGPGKWKP